MEWIRPAGWRDAPTRRVLGAQAGLAEVPSVGWVSRFAEQCGDCTRHGHALVELDTVTGLR